MKITCPPGFRTDHPPVSPSPFWFHGQNVRFHKGMPETIGLFGKVLDALGDPITVATGGELVSMFSDESVVLFGYGNKILAVQYPGGTSRQFTFAEAGTGGRWWFVTTEDDIITGRSNLDGKTYVLSRADIFDFVEDPVSLLANAPIGGKAAGIYGGILIKAGTTGVAGGDDRMIVRWSARRTDTPAAAPFGFERWTPDDESASGEYPIENGSRIVGGGSTDLGFVFWTDISMQILRPRTDTYVFTLAPLAQRGLLATDCWCEADGRIWWFDQTRTLNVFDGGAPRQIINPMSHVSVETIDEDALDGCYVSVDVKYAEIHLHYPGNDGVYRELVYNYVEDAWYPFVLDRVAMTDAHGIRPSIGITRGGDLYFYELRETIPSALVFPTEISFTPPPITTTPTPDIGPPEDFDFFLMTNMIAGKNATMTSIRSRNVSLSHTYAVAPDSDETDTIHVAVQSYGKMDIKEVPTVDTKELALGKILAPLRAGGKMLQYVIWGTGMTTMVRFGDLDVEADEGGEK